MEPLATPELDKQRDIINSGKAALIQEFYDWLHDQGIRLAEYDPTSRFGRMEPHHFDGQPEKCMAAFFGIDLDKIESERRAILASLSQ